MAEPPVVDHVENCISLHAVNARTATNVPGLYRAIVEIRFEMQRLDLRASYAKAGKPFVCSLSKQNALTSELVSHVNKSSKHSDIVSKTDEATLKPATITMLTIVG